MTNTEFTKNERRKVWKERLQIAAGSFTFGCACALVWVCCDVLNMLLGKIR